MSMDTFLVTNEAGLQYIQGHPGWLIGDEIETARLLTADELMDHGYGILVKDVAPPYNAQTQTLTRNPISEWVHEERLVTVTYTVTDLTPEEIRERMPPLNPAQIRLGLLAIGIREADVEAAIGDDEAALIDWRTRPSYRRLHPLVLALSAADKFNLPAAQVDTLWMWAKDL